jgi:hypothetical protein
VATIVATRKTPLKTSSARPTPLRLTGKRADLNPLLACIEAGVLRD